MTDRLRFDVALYTVADAARIVDVHPSTLATWAKGYRRNPRDGRPVVGPRIITATAAGRWNWSLLEVGNSFAADPGLPPPDHLRRGDYASSVTSGDVVADPTRSRAIFQRGGARVDAERFWSTLQNVAEEFGVPVDHIEDVVRVTSRRAA